MNEERDVCVRKIIVVTAASLLVAGLAARQIKKVLDDKKRYARVKYLYTKEF